MSIGFDLVTKRFGAIISSRLHNVTTTNPTVNDDSGDGYGAGSIWLNTNADIIWICIAATAGAAVWRPVTAVGLGGGGGTISVATLFSQSMWGPGQAFTSTTPSTILARVGWIYLPADISAARVSFRVTNTAQAGAQERFTLYSFDGQTTHIDVAVTADGGSGIKTATFAAVNLKAGFYFVMFCRADANGGTSPTIVTNFGDSPTLAGPTSGLVDLQGTVAVTAGAAPSPLDPTSITPVTHSIGYFRLDNA
jgi:hypothetical protein